MYVSLFSCHPYCVVDAIHAREVMIGAGSSDPKTSAATAGDDCRGSFPSNPLHEIQYTKSYSVALSSCSIIVGVLGPHEVLTL